MSEEKAVLIPPDFSLQKKIGAPAKYMKSDRLHKADAAVKALAENLDAINASFLHALKSRDSTWDRIYAMAHEFRGLAGSFQRKPQGKIADALCRYIDAARDINRSPDMDVLSTLRQALLACDSLGANDPYASEKMAEAASDAAMKKIDDLKKS